MVSPRRVHYGWLAFGVICIIAAAIGGLAMYAAWDHNPQLAFHEDGVIHWGAWFAVGLSWFVAIAGIPSVVALVALSLSFFRRTQ